MTFTVAAPRGVIELRTLGSLDLKTSDGLECRSTLAQAKRMALLSYLAVAHPQGFHRRDTLVGLFWPDLDQRHARAALRQALHFLRQTLGRDVVLNRGPEEIGVDFTSVWSDVVEFEELLGQGETARAVDLYSGPLLKGFYIHNAPEFEKWLGTERERLARLYAGGLRHLAETAAANGNPRNATHWWMRLATHDPYSSEVACQLIAAMEASGDRAGAIAQGKVHIDAVRFELEVEPHSEVVALVEQLRTNPPNQPLVTIADHTQPKNPPPAVTLESAFVETPAKNHNWIPLRYLWVAILLLVFSGSALLGFRETGEPSTHAPVSLAVLPFENLGSPDDDYYAIGLVQDIVSRLAGVQNIALLGPNDGGLDSPDEPAWFGQASLDAQFILRGSVERTTRTDGTTAIRLVPSLVRVADGSQIWSETIEKDLPRVFDGQTRIAEEVTRLLDIRPLSAERQWLRAAPTSDLAAYDLYLKANDHLRRASTSAEHARSAVTLFQQATERDSVFVQAFAKLAIAHTSMFWWNHDRTPQRLTAARTAADRAIQLRPDIPNTHLALGWYYYWGEREYDRALRHFELARTNWPGVSDVEALIAAIRRRQGDFAQSLQDHYGAAARDPSCVTCLSGAAFTQLMLRDFTAAERDIAKALAIAPDFPYARIVGAMARLSDNGDTAAARITIGPPPSSNEVIRLSSGHWSAVPRILGGQYDSVVAAMMLNEEIVDTAGYYLTKAELASRRQLPDDTFAYYDSAQTILTKLVGDQPEDPRLQSRLGVACAGLGWRDRAVRSGTEAIRLRPISEDAVDGPLAVEMLARIYAMLGEPDAAIDRLEMLISIPSHVSAQSIRLDPAWAPLRTHRRFQLLVN